MNNQRWNEITETAKGIGTQHGLNAAYEYAYFILGGPVRASNAEQAREIRDRIAAGDEEIISYFPRADLSGEWADGYTPARLAADCDLHYEDEDYLWDLCDVYEEAFDEVVRTTIPWILNAADIMS